MTQYFFNIPLLKSKILFEISDGDYKKNREPQLADHFIFVKNNSNLINPEIINNIEDVLFHLYKKKDRYEEDSDSPELKYKAYYKKYNTYIRQENKLPLYLNNTIVIFEELYSYIIKQYENTSIISDIPDNEEYHDIEEISLSIDEPVMPSSFSGTTEEKQQEIPQQRISASIKEREEYDSSFLFDHEDNISVGELKDSMGINEEDFDSDSDVPDFPVEDPDVNKNKSRFTSKPVNITKDEENGEFLLTNLLDQAGFDKKDGKK